MPGFLDALATIGPQILAGFGNKTQTLGNVLAVQDSNRQLAEKENLKAFGSELFNLPQESLTKDAIFQAAQRHSVDPMQAMKTFGEVLASQENNRMLSEKERMKSFGNELFNLPPEQWNKDTIFQAAKKYEVDPLQAMKLVVAVKGMTPEEQPMEYSKILPGGQIQQIKVRPSELQQYGDPKSFMPGIIKGPGGVSVNVGGPTIYPSGNMPLTKPQVNKTQEDVIKGIDMIGRLKTIRKSYNPKFLTWFGKANKGITSIQGKLGLRLSKEDKEAITGATKFYNMVEQQFNLYRKEITGAAASVQELDRLRKSMFNTDQSPAEFEASLNIFESESKRALRLKQKLLRNGVPVGTDNFGDQMDRAFLSGHAANTDADTEARGEELETQGFSEEEVKQRLVDEGYIVPKKGER